MPYPADTMKTRLPSGVAVPLVVRMELKTFNRGIAEIAVLDDPFQCGKQNPFTPSLWNGDIYNVFGSSAGSGYGQGARIRTTFGNYSVRSAAVCFTPLMEFYILSHNS